MTGLTLIAHGDTDIGTLYLGHRQSIAQADPVFEIGIDGQLLMCSINNASERRMSTSGLHLHRGTGPLRVLVGGLGLGYTAQAVLAFAKVGSLRVVEKMDFVVGWMKEGLLPLSAALGADDRMEIVSGDIYQDLLGPVSETYDVILVDVDHAPHDRLSDASLPFYSVDGQRNVARHLNPGGVLVVWSAHNNDDFADVMAQVYPGAHREGVDWEDEEDPGTMVQNVLFLGETPEA